MMTDSSFFFFFQVSYPFKLAKIPSMHPSKFLAIQAIKVQVILVRLKLTNLSDIYRRAAFKSTNS